MKKKLLDYIPKKYKNAVQEFYKDSCGYARHDSGTVYKVKDIFPNKYNPQVLFVSLVTGKRTYTRAIQTDKLGNEFAQYGTGYGRDRSFSSIIVPMN